MATDGLTISSITNELSRVLTGGRVIKITQPEPDMLILTVKTSEDSYKLLISANASVPLIHLTENNRVSPMTAPNFCMVLRKYILNGRILQIRQPGLERCVHIDIEHYDEMGDLRTLTLIAEIMGKHSNIILCNDNDMIIDSIKHISFAVSSVREVLPGRQYFLPVTSDKLDPLNLDEYAFDKQMSEKASSVSVALYTLLTGISPIIAQEICFRAGIDSDLPVNSLDEGAFIRLRSVLSEIMEQIRSKQYTPVMYISGELPVEFAVCPLSIYQNSMDMVNYSSISKCVEDYYSQKEKITRIRHKSADLRHIVQTNLERALRKLDLQTKQLRDTNKRDKYKVYGELINTYGYSVPEGSASMEALDFYTNETVTIPLDETMTPLENAQKYFEKYQKLKRTYEALTVQVMESQREVDYLKSVASNIDIADNEADLSQIREELRQSGLIKSRSNSKKERFKSEPLHYISSDGYHMYVGKNNLQNDELSHRFAQGCDWWFHAKKRPGSHVIVKTNGDELPDSTFEEAAKLAAHFSSGGDAEKIEVDYVQKKHLKKPAGTPPGYVIYHTNYSILAETDISGIRLVSDIRI